MKSFFANIWIGGNHDDAVRACREFCVTTNVCVTVTPTTYVFVRGAEPGVLVRLIQYPRFPEPEETIRQMARALAEHLRLRLFQRSYSIEFPDETIYDGIELARG